MITAQVHIQRRILLQAAPGQKKKTSNSSSSSSSSSSGSDKNSSSSNSSSSSNAGTNEKLSHTHNWVAVYKEVDNGYYDIVTKKEAYACCWQCGADITGNISTHLKAHALAGDENASWRTEYRYYDVQEWVPNIEKVVDYYKCSCGATK